MSAYREFTGKSVEEALRLAREDFGVGLDGLDFEILTPGSRGVLGMGAEPARILAAPRSELGGAAPKREAAAARPLPPPPPMREDRGDRSASAVTPTAAPRRDDRGDATAARAGTTAERPAAAATTRPATHCGSLATTDRRPDETTARPRRDRDDRPARPRSR